MLTTSTGTVLVQEQTWQQKLDAMRAYYESGATKPYAFRRQQLEKLKQSLLDHVQEIFAALYKDLKKSPEECWVTENGFVLTELNVALQQLRSWMKPEKVRTNLLNIPSSSYIMHEPLGVTLIIAPWNYPLMLLLTPLIGAMAAGNCVVLKPSEFAPATEAVIKKMIRASFPETYILVAEGEGAQVVPGMMEHFRFDHVFYTGSTAVGRIIYTMAAKQLVPVTLELGGKSPCIISSDARIDIAAKRIALTKFSNAGQMCVAPDYLLVHSSVKENFIERLIYYTRKLYNEDPATCYNYGRIINSRQFNRLAGYLKQGRILYGGQYNAADLYIAPTIMDQVDLQSPVMQDEIFGPLLPVIPFTTDAEALQVISANRNPLSFYVFTESRKIARFWLQAVPAGGAAVNNCSWHLTNHRLPFGGRGFSGLGQYHGKFSFETFSHKKSVLETPTWFDPGIKYPPFKGKLKLFKWVIR